MASNGVVTAKTAEVPSSPDSSLVAVRGYASAREATQAVLDLISNLLGVRVCVVTRVDLATNTLTVVEALDKANAGIRAGMVMPASELPCDFVVRSATPLKVYELDAHPSFRDLPARTKLGLRSYLGVPLKRSDGSVWGTIAATDTDLRETTDTHVQTLLVLARLLTLEFEREEQREALEAQAKALTERLAMAKALERERVRAVRLQTVIESMATVSHEINNPLTVLQLRLGRLMKRYHPVDDDTADDLDTALDAANEIQRVTVHLRSVVQPVSTHYLSGKSKMIDLAESIKVQPNS